MSQKQIKQKKCRITLEDLHQKFDNADTNGDGSLSVDEITNLLQSLGYEDTYKGTIRKICRYLNKQKRLKQKQSTISQTKNQEQDQQKSEQIKSSRIKQSQIKKKQQQQEGITFDEFAKYFEILQKPIGKILYSANLQRSASIADLRRTINIDDTFHKDKGQKLKFRFLVGEQKSNYNSELRIKLTKELKDTHTYGIFFFQFFVKAHSQDNAKTIIKLLNSICSMIIELIKSQNQEFEEIDQIIKLSFSTEGNIAKCKIETEDEDVKKFIRQYFHTFDQILESQVTLFVDFLYQFDLFLQQIKQNANRVIEDIFAKDANIEIKYSGSQFLDVLKQIALSEEIFAIFTVLYINPLSADYLGSLALLGFLSMEKGDFFFKFKNLERKKTSKALTQEILTGLNAFISQFQQQIPSQELNIKNISELVDGPIIINLQAQNIKLNVNINIKDLLKLPFLLNSDNEIDSEDGE